jgi:mono/diheme cytochrome c family protein
MKRALKLAGVATGGVVVILLLAIGTVYGASRSRQTATFTAAPADFPIPTDPASIAEGDRLFDARGCSDCHGEDGGGRVRIDDPALGRFVSANLTHFASADAATWSRAVRDGLRADGTPLMFMPAAELNPMPDRELGAIIAYVRTLPRVDAELPPQTVGPIARLVDLMGGFPLFPAHDVDHRARPADIPPGRNPDMGAYLVRGCTGCHGAHLSGGPIPGAPVEEVGIPVNLTFHATGLAGWSEADFRTALREGRTRDGATLSPTFMPWQTTLRFMSDEEIGAVYDYLQTVPHRPEGER